MGEGVVRGEVRKIKGYEGIGVTFKKILREEGYRGFYRGMGVNLVRTVPSSALTILSFVARRPSQSKDLLIVAMRGQIRSHHASTAGAQSPRGIPLVASTNRRRRIHSFNRDPSSSLRRRRLPPSPAANDDKAAPTGSTRSAPRHSAHPPPPIRKTSKSHHSSISICRFEAVIIRSYARYHLVVSHSRRSFVLCAVILVDLSRHHFDFDSSEL